MGIGPILSLLSAVCFAAGQVFIKKGAAQAGESFTAVFLSVFIGTILFGFPLIFTGDWQKIWSLSWSGLALLAAGGLAHFVFGRYLGYGSIRLLGANVATVISRTNLFYAVIFAAIFLHETVTVPLIIGVILIGGGAMLVSVGKEEKTIEFKVRGVIIGLAGAFFWGISGVLIKPGIEEIGSPLAAVLVSHIAASVVMAGFLFSRDKREQLTRLSRNSTLFLSIAGISTSIAQLLRYIALSYSPVSIVNPLLSTGVIIVILFSFLLNRHIEVFTWRVYFGVAVTVAGAVLLFQ